MADACLFSFASLSFFSSPSSSSPSPCLLILPRGLGRKHKLRPIAGLGHDEEPIFFSLRMALPLEARLVEIADCSLVILVLSAGLWFRVMEEKEVERLLTLKNGFKK